MDIHFCVWFCMPVLIIGITVRFWHSSDLMGKPMSVPTIGDESSGQLAPPVNDVDDIFTLVVQNIQKQYGLAGRLVKQFAPDVMLVQEIKIKTEDASQFAHFTPGGHGTAIYCKSGKPRDMIKVESPAREFGGIIYKKTTVAKCMGVQFISFHGYNGSPFRDVEGLLTHVKAVVKVLDLDGPAIFAGDFNTWSQEHLDAVVKVLGEVGLNLAASWRYPQGRGKKVLDHIFVRGLKLLHNSTFQNEADHLGAKFVVLRE